MASTQKTSAELRKQLQDELGGARGFLGMLFDEGTFAETGAFVKRIPSDLDAAFGVKNECDFEPVVTGYGSVNGSLVFAFVQDFSKLKGAFSAASARKIVNLIESGVKAGAPIVCVFNSAGAILTDGVCALEGYGSVMKALSDAKGLVPLISIVNGVCAASAATAAAMADFVLATENASIYINPPFILKNRFDDEKAGSSETGVKNGLVDVIAADDASVCAEARKVLNLLPANAETIPLNDTDDNLNRLTPEISSIVDAGCDMMAIIASVSDEGIFFETGKGFAPELLTGIVQIGGLPVGLVATQPAVNNGRLTSAAAVKAVKLIDFCGAFDMPILTFVATDGIDVSLESENAPYASALASLAAAYASHDGAKVTVVLEKAYGQAFTLLGSKSLGADIVYALDRAKIGIMPADTAAQFIGGFDKKAEVAEQWSSLMTSPLSAAREGAIDDIIDSCELRQRIASAFEMLVQ